MKYFSSILITIIFASIVNFSYAQVSDYQLAQNYKIEYDKLKNDITNTLTLSELDSLSKSIVRLQNSYKSHTGLINSAHYPSTYDEMMGELTELILAAEHRLVLIENQQEQISNLSQRLASFAYEIDHLRSETKRLRIEIAETSDRNSTLERRMKDYREQIQKRDQVIIAFTDTLIKQYNELRGKTNTDINEINHQEIALNELNILELIQSVIDDHYADEEFGYQPLTSDYIRMFVIAQQFEDIIDRIDDEVAGLYSNSIEIDTLKTSLFDWKADLEDKTWTSIKYQMQALDIQTSGFYDKTTFISTLENHIQSHIHSNKENPFIENQYDEYMAFNTFWNDMVKSDWGIPMIESGLISTQQIAYVDESLSAWYALARPQSYTLQLIAGFLILLIFTLGVVIWKLY